jgi:competence protein ComEA
VKPLVLVGVLLLAGLARADEAPRPRAVAAVAGPIDINRASLGELCQLPGIGPKKAEAILAFRAKRPFTRLSQLLEVKGIGPRTLQRLRPLLTVGPPVPDAGT